MPKLACLPKLNEWMLSRLRKSCDSRFSEKYPRGSTERNASSIVVPLYARALMEAATRSNRMGVKTNKSLPLRPRNGWLVPEHPHRDLARGPQDHPKILFGGMKVRMFKCLLSLLLLSHPPPQVTAQFSPGGTSSSLLCVEFSQ